MEGKVSGNPIMYMEQFYWYPRKPRVSKNMISSRKASKLLFGNGGNSNKHWYERSMVKKLYVQEQNTERNDWAELGILRKQYGLR